MKNFVILISFLFSYDYCFATVTYSKPDLKTIEKKLDQKGLNENIYPKDSIIKPASPTIILRSKKGKKTDAHRLGLMSFGAVFLSYILITASFFTFPLYIWPFMRGLSRLGYLSGLGGFFTAIISLFKYRKEKNKKGKGFPIASILMVLLPIIAFIVLIIQLLTTQVR